MNHLVGAVSDALADVIKEDERWALENFQAAYLSHPDADAAAQPAWQQVPEALPASGWRPLDDVTLLRFLRADRRGSNFNLDASSARLLAALQWRRTMRSDALIAEPPKDYDDYELLRVRRWTGRDLRGCPVQYERLGHFLASGNAKAYTNEAWLQLYARDLETTFAKMRQASMACGRPIISYTYCGDMGGASGVMRHWGSTIPLLKFLTHEVEAHFPEIVGKIVLFNVPAFFAQLFKVVKMFMDPITAAKVEVYNGVPIDKLRELMPTEAIPIDYGGSSTISYPKAITHHQDGLCEERTSAIS